MTMQAGLDWKEEYHHPFSENSKQYFVEDLAQQAFETECKEMPGQHYEYQSVAAQLLGLALRKATQKILLPIFLKNMETSGYGISRKMEH